MICQSGLWRSSEKIQTLTGMVVPNVCSGGLLASDWTCGSGQFYIDMVFSEPFLSPPQVSSSISSIGPYSPCMGGAMDSIQTYSTNITNIGFRLYGGASPFGSNCTYPNMWGTAQVSYIAVGVKK